MGTAPRGDRRGELVPKTVSWYMGSNVKGSPRRLLYLISAASEPIAECDEVVARNYEGFAMR